MLCGDELFHVWESALHQLGDEFYVVPLEEDLSGGGCYVDGGVVCGEHAVQEIDCLDGY